MHTYEHGNEPLASTKGKGHLDQLVTISFSRTVLQIMWTWRKLEEW